MKLNIDELKEAEEGMSKAEMTVVLELIKMAAQAKDDDKKKIEGIIEKLEKALK